MINNESKTNTAQIAALVTLSNTAVHNAFSEMKIGRKGYEASFETSLALLEQTTALASATIKLIGLEAEMLDKPPYANISGLKIPELSLQTILNGSKRAPELLRHIVSEYMKNPDSDGVDSAFLQEKMGYKRLSGLRDPIHPLYFKGLIENHVEGGKISLTEMGKLLFLDGPLSTFLLKSK